MINAHERCLIAVDLDDTALQDLRELNPVTRMVLRKAAADGHRVMLATARPSCMTMEHYQALELDTPLCLSNGADYFLPGDSSFPPGRDYIPSGRLREILSLCPQRILKGVWVENDDELRVSRGWMGEESSYFREMYNRSRVRALWPENPPGEGAGRLFLWVEESPEAPWLLAQLRLFPGIEVKSRPWQQDSGVRIYSLGSVFANKWYCVEKTAAYYGIPPERIIAFGDALNDLRMLQNAAQGFAMCNGDEQVRRVSSLRVTRWTNQEGGVGRELNELLHLGLDLEG
ncbi:MAG: HAD hydrolase family protein [Oscillospiraceae bacterium]|jgi:hydroxymethylpyrimidine pyrophosphatase-like HAD family hydrolase|nr:HAD hydrolase family protein [Oscillospiraceae bacterium]